jgi:diguanylate cyclase (GGDEF)-like protein
VAGLLPPAVAAAMHLLAPARLADLGALGWVAVAAPAAAGLATSAGSIVLLGSSLPRRGAAALVEAGSFGALTVGLALATLAAVGDPARLPGPELAITSAVGGLLLLAGLALRNLPAAGRSGLVAATVGLFLLLETLLGAALLGRSWATPVAAWLLVAAAGAASAALVARTAVNRLRPAPAWLFLVAGSLAALALARPGTLDAVPGLLGLLLAGALAAAEAFIERSGDDAAQAAAAADVAEPLPEPPPLTLVPDREPPTAGLERDRAESQAAEQRLARELRGTIEELLQARRIVELQREEIARASTTDPLTGLPNRSAILERLRLEVAEARRYSHPVAIALFDVDGLGALNTAHGLAIGDAVLRELSLRIRLRVRTADALGRAGEDSFLAILPHTDEGGAATFVRTLLRRLTDRPIATEVGELSVSVSVGVALIRPGMDLRDEGLLAAAEEAVRSARAAGGNRIAFDRLHGLARIDDRRG